MAKYRTQDIRNVVLAGHGGAGKTSLVDAMLFEAKACERKGSVDQESSLSDFDDEEKQRRFSIDATVLHCDWKGKRIQLIDTPGYPDFIGACLSCLPAAETAAVVINAADGIQVNTRRVFQAAEQQHLARLVVLNKLDAENVDFQALIDTIRDTFGKRCVPMNLPVGRGADFSAVVDLLSGWEQAPDGVLADPAHWHSQLLETAVEADEELMMRYLEGEELSEQEVAEAVTKAMAAGSLVPILCTSAKSGLGVPELLDAIATFALSPDQLPRTAASTKGDQGGQTELAAAEDAPLVAQVFKTVTDPFVGKLSYLRVFCGKLQGDSSVLNVRTGRPCKVGHLLRMQGKQQQTVSEAIAGDIVAVAKVEDLAWGDTVASSPDAPAMPVVRMPTPMVAQSVQPKARGDEQKISGSLSKVADEDPTFKVRRDRETKELVISGMSELHLSVIRSRLRRRFQLEMDVKPPRIPYRETITAPADDSYRHKKQTGGRGQFGEVHLRLFPLPRGGIEPDEYATKERFPELKNHHYHEDVNFLFIDSIAGGVIPGQFMPAVEKGIRETIDAGVLAGYTVQDVAAEVFFGKHHSVDSSEAAFKIAASMAFKQAFQKAKPVLLEPIVNIEVTVPTDNMGDIMADLSGRRGRIQGSDTLSGGLATVRAQIPLAEVSDYARSLGSITGGRGSYTIEPSHYDIVPANVQMQIIEKAKREKESA